MLKKFIALGLSLLLTLGLFACNSKSDVATNNEKNNELWVLSREYQELSDGEIIRDIIYSYDSEGRLIGETREAGFSYETFNYKHDENGNVISKTESYKDSDKYTYYSYLYNADNKVKNKTITYSHSNEKEEITYEYDKHGNVVLLDKTYIVNGQIFSSTVEKSFLLSENEGFLQYEVEVTHDSEDTNYFLDEMYYDENGNKTTQITYSIVPEDEGDINSTKTVNGRIYQKDTTTTFIYEKIVIEKNEVTEITKRTTSLPVSQWGFENSNIWNDTLVQVQETTSGNFVFNDRIGDYVIIKEGTSHWEFYPYQGQFLGSSIYTDFIPKSTRVYQYTVLNNDMISVVEPDESYTLKITDRIEEDDIVIFEVLNVNRNVYLIPFDLIDTTIPPVFYESGDSYSSTSFDYYKFYLK